MRVPITRRSSPRRRRGGRRGRRPSTASKHHRPGASPVALVNFELDTWLRRYRQARPQAPRDDDDGRIWDPSRVRSEALLAAFAAATRCARLRAPVLLLGERGTGKTTLANLIRSRSPHQRLGERPWPVVVCGQFRANPQLARSELFGQKRGAFTGATASRPGLIEQADCDTLFLDEGANLDHDTRVPDLGVADAVEAAALDRGHSEALGFRLISATNRTLAELRGGLLDHDFLDRLAVFVVRSAAARLRRRPPGPLGERHLRWHRRIQPFSRRFAHRQ